VVLPGSTDEVAAVVRTVPRPALPSCPRAAIPGCAAAPRRPAAKWWSLTRLNRIRAVDADNNSITVEAGCTLHAVQEAAREADRLFPLSLAAEGSATIGGNLSTNAGGVQVLRYGNARELCWASRRCWPTVASGTACAACARTTPATTSSTSSSAPKARWA
jgi:FAD/FMN-containing dehydrogenase